MTTLYRRASPSQVRILRAVEGAVHNAAHHHPDWKITSTMARSIAKRAAGTLTAQWPEVLAAKPSDQGGGGWQTHRPSAGDLIAQTERGASQPVRRPPLKLLRLRLGIMAGSARKEGHDQRAAAFADALRALAAVEAESAA